MARQKIGQNLESNVLHKGFNGFKGLVISQRYLIHDPVLCGLIDPAGQKEGNVIMSRHHSSNNVSSQSLSDQQQPQDTEHRPE